MRIAVIENEFGAVNVDEMLIEKKLNTKELVMDYPPILVVTVTILLVVIICS